MTKKVAVIRGDGIGPEIIEQALKVLEAVGSRFGHTFRFQEVDAGGCAIDRHGHCLPGETLEACLQADSVLLGAVGGPKWDGVEKSNRPEQALLRIRSAMGLYANMRPARLLPPLAAASPLRREVAEGGFDFLVVRELIGGIYFGDHQTGMVDGVETAADIMRYSQPEIQRIAHTAFQTARKRRGKVTSVDKANVLDCSRLWRKVVVEVGAQYPDVALSHMYVDNCAMQIVHNPAQFDVIVTENMFGDILSDEASMITGSIGMIPSSSLGEGTRGMYEPIHGSAPDIAGKDLANPVGTILSAAMMLRDSFGMEAESRAVEDAVARVLADGLRTGDMMAQGCRQVGCAAMGDAIASCVAQ